MKIKVIFGKNMNGEGKCLGAVIVAREKKGKNKADFKNGFIPKLINMQSRIGW